MCNQESESVTPRTTSDKFEQTVMGGEVVFGVRHSANKLFSHYRPLPLTMSRLKTWYSFVQAGSSCFKLGKYEHGWTDWFCSISQPNLL